jgi:hypothetical protein
MKSIQTLCMTLMVMLLMVATTASAQQREPMRDVVYLKNGSVIKGIITEQVPDSTLKIETSDGSLFVYPMSEVARITKEVVSTRDSFNKQLPTERYRTHGYKGFIETGYTVGTGDINLGRLEFLTTHGYLVNPYFYIGAGMGWHYYTSLESASAPFFIDARTYFRKGKVVPYAGLKLGYTVGEVEGFYLAPSVGVKMMVSYRAAVNFSLGYTYQAAESNDRCWEDYTDTLNGNVGGVTFRVGFEF